MQLPPDPDQEYILLFDHPPAPGNAVIVPRDTIVTKVMLIPNDSYIARAMAGGVELAFTVKATGERFTTHYGYMFARNTPENLERVAAYRKAYARFEEAQAAKGVAFDGIDRVKGPFEGYFGPASS